ncbi:MAG: hypothetical protein J5762_02865 [Clostridia bacterium]|nr:hypothetical protein [Clostridia bacterium]
MKYYFFSPVTAFIMRGDSVLGKISRNVRYVHADESAAFEIISPDFLPTVVSGAGLKVNAREYPFYYGKLFIPEFIPIPKSHKTIYETKTAFYGKELIIRVYDDGTPKLDVFFYGGQVTVSIPFSSADVAVSNLADCALIEIKGRLKHVVLFSLKSMKIIFSTTCVDLVAKQTLTIKRLITGSNIYLLQEHYEVTDKVSLMAKSLTPKYKRAPKTTLGKKLAFLESVAYGGDFSRLLSPAIADKADVIKEFLGEFDYVIPPTEKDFPSTFALIGKDVRYVDISTENDIVCDVSVDHSP